MKKYPFLQGEIRPIQGARMGQGTPGGAQARVGSPDRPQVAPIAIQSGFQFGFWGAGEPGESISQLRVSAWVQQLCE